LTANQHRRCDEPSTKNAYQRVASLVLRVFILRPFPFSYSLRLLRGLVFVVLYLLSFSASIF